jgi:signal transduction histidine kinase
MNGWGPRRWWARRSISVRVTIAATVALSVGLVFGVVALAVLFSRNQIASVDAAAQREANTLAGLVESGQLPDPLPAPADEPVLAQIVGPDGAVVSSTQSAGRVPIVPAAELTALHSGQAFTTERSSLGSAPLRVVVQRVATDNGVVTVVAAVPYGEVRDVLSESLLVLIVAVPVALAAAGIATWLAVRSSLRPVDAMSAAAIAHGDTTAAPRLPVPDSDDEIARLAVALNGMLDQLHEASEAQRAFVADAAHELRSPVASIQTQLDVALSIPTSKAQWGQVAASVRTDVGRLAELVEDLLLLARLDAAAPQRIERVDIRRLLDVPGEPLWVDADRSTLRRAYDNIVANANRHAHAKVTVECALHDQLVVVTVDDDGDGVPEADREHVFERWVRLDEGRTRDQGGAGLGLPLARSIVRSHGGEVTIGESPLGGARVTLTIPAAPSLDPADSTEPRGDA